MYNCVYIHVCTGVYTCIHTLQASTAQCKHTFVLGGVGVVGPSRISPPPRMRHRCQRKSSLLGRAHLTSREGSAPGSRWKQSFWARMRTSMYLHLIQQDNFELVWLPCLFPMKSLNFLFLCDWGTELSLLSHKVRISLSLRLSLSLSLSLCLHTCTSPALSPYVFACDCMHKSVHVFALVTSPSLSCSRRRSQDE